MFELHASWWELPVRAALIYAALLVMVRVSGRRTVGQFTPFDLLVVMLLSEAVSSALNGGEDSVTGGLLAAATLVVLNISVAFLTSRSAGARVVFDGRPVLIGSDGVLYDDALRAHRIPRADVEQALREADCDLHDMQLAVLETDGKISILQEASGPAEGVALVGVQ